MDFIKVCTTIIFIIQPVAFSNGAQVFAIVPMYGRSHWNVMDAVLQTLVSAGHNVTVVTPFIKNEKITNYTQIDSSPYLKRSSSAPFEMIFGSNGIDFLIKTHQTTCEALYESKEFWTALESNKYDIFITQLLGSGCDSYIAYKLQVPMIAVSSSAFPTQFNGPNGNQLVPSCTSTLNVPLACPQTFWDRLLNSYDYVLANTLRWWYDRRATEIGRQYFGEDAPDGYALLQKMALVFVNSHFTFHSPRPWTPNLIEIGGIHVTDPKPLPEDIQQFIDDAPDDGVIYFSFGSTVKMDSLPTRMQNSLRDAFAEMPQRILWKYDADKMENQPRNVMIKKWFPQRDILAHPKVKLLIYHGGLSGMYEAINNQVPILGIPLFSDQHRNLANSIHLGLGLSLDAEKLNKQSLLAAVREIITNKKYKKNVQDLYRMFKDRPMSPKELVAYWTEYTINHGDVDNNIRTTAIRLPWYEYYLLDVTLVISLTLLTALAILLYALVLTKKILRPLKKYKSD
ncbi:UDP-glucuronosyl/UDP-glucosyltransferase [Cinara cedri]|uniref:UDP-glucuronosyl/UDP-glucosyltransferase n=1 Tax=Cinara cedri TaxID=506608 RepID=A0A5E4MWG3_9HEMI|nr:UDP-glucuronosyl/UDP-glucosyltransferase [Cinara cedri]